MSIIWIYKTKLYNKLYNKFYNNNITLINIILFYISYINNSKRSLTERVGWTARNPILSLCFEVHEATATTAATSSAMPTAPTAGSSGSSSANQQVAETILGRSDAGNLLKLLESKHGEVRFEVWEVQPSRTVVWGQIRSMSFARRPTYKAICKLHKNCHCVINCMKHEPLVEWLAVAGNKSAAEHEQLSREVRNALGMRVRAKPWGRWCGMLLSQ